MLTKPPKPTAMALNLAPMVDVMMCLIIFFLLASKLVTAEQGKTVKLPWAAAAKEVERSDLGARVVINVRQSQGTDDTAEYVIADWDGDNVVERVLPPAQVEGFLAARAGRATQDHQTLRCVIRADKDVLYRHVETVIRACGSAKLANLVFSANSGPEPEGGE
jgi:biopolymer transport protein ExbD